MKFFITLLVMVVVMILAVPAFAGEEPYMAVVYEDSEIPPFYISQKLAQFTHPETFYYGHCYYYFRPADGIPIDPKVCYLPDPDESEYFLCPSKCQERFRSKTAQNFPEVCCGKDTTECPDIGNSRITKGYSGWYEWVIGFPNKPVDELSIVIECGVLKPDALEIFGQDAINLCAAETGEIINPGLCERKPGSSLKAGALPTIIAMAYPGSQNYFEGKPGQPYFHLTAYRTPGLFGLPPYTDPNNKNIQLLDGSLGTRIALKTCMKETIMIVLPKPGRINVLGETEANLEAGDLIKVRMDVPMSNTVDIYCSTYSVKISGIGEPPWIPADELPCLYDECGL